MCGIRLDADDAAAVDEVKSDVEVGKDLGNDIVGARQFAAVEREFRLFISAKARDTTRAPAIVVVVNFEDFRVVEQDRCSDLVEGAFPEL